MQTFIGVDLAWRVDGRHSGAVVLSGGSEAVRLTSHSRDLWSIAEVVEFIVHHATINTVVAIDASLVVRNAKGQRPCETAIGKVFGRAGASCHSTNLGRPYAQTGGVFVAALQDRGFEHDFDLETAKRRAGRWIFEVYPHPAMIRLFGLRQIIRYKKGSVALRRSGLTELQRHLRELQGLEQTRDLAILIGADLDSLRGQALKQYEDSLDALFCAYLAWYCWAWGSQRNEMFGDLQNGYIVVPTPT
jgi:predicted RNase H-like nuclease